MSARAVINTPREDREGDVIVPRGVHLDNYRNNPVVLWEHGLGELTRPIAKCQQPDGKLALGRGRGSIYDGYYGPYGNYTYLLDGPFDRDDSGTVVGESLINPATGLPYEIRYNQHGYNQYGFDVNGYDPAGFDTNGLNADGETWAYYGVCGATFTRGSRTQIIRTITVLSIWRQIMFFSTSRRVRSAWRRGSEVAATL